MLAFIFLKVASSTKSNCADLKYIHFINQDKGHAFRPHVHKENENEDQAQNQTYKLQLLDKKSCEYDEYRQCIDKKLAQVVTYTTENPKIRGFESHAILVSFFSFF